MMHSRLLSGALITSMSIVGSVGLGTATADADPSGNTVNFICDNGANYTAVVFSSGAWSPALDSVSNSVLIPLSFGLQTYVVRDNDGNIVQSGSIEPYAKHANPGVSTTTTCTFTFHQSVTDRELGPITVDSAGSAAGFVTPAH